jgi:hypothetical protein
MCVERAERLSADHQALKLFEQIRLAGDLWQRHKALGEQANSIRSS